LETFSIHGYLYFLLHDKRSDEARKSIKD
jgi:hypothetical protein